MIRNVAGQGVYLRAVSAEDGGAITTGVTATVSKDGGAAAASANAPTHLGGGVWWLALSQAETDAAMLAIAPAATDLLPDPVLVATLDATIGSRMPTTHISATAGKVDGVATVDALGTQAKADVNAEVDTALADYDAPTKAELDAGLAGLNDLDATEAQAAAAAALNAYDPPTKAEMDAALLTISNAIAALNDYDGSDTSGTTTLLARLTDLRAGYLDKLNVSGTLAHSDAASTYKADVSALALETTAGAAKTAAEAAQTNTADLPGMIEDGAFTAPALANAPTGGGGSGPSAEEIRQEIDANSTQLAAIKAKTDAMPSAEQNADALLDRADAIETGWTLRKAMRVMAAVLAGKASGAGTPTNVFNDLTDTKPRVTATVDESGNRTTITLDGD